MLPAITGIEVSNLLLQKLSHEFWVPTLSWHWQQEPVQETSTCLVRQGFPALPPPCPVSSYAYNLSIRVKLQQLRNEAVPRCISDSHESCSGLSEELKEHDFILAGVKNPRPELDVS